jgi:amidase
MQVIRGKTPHYTFDPNVNPVCRVKPSELFVIETEINVGDAIRTEKDRLGPGSIHWPYVNPLTGPIYVETVKPGDAIAIHIDQIEIIPPVYCALVPGWSAFSPWFGREDFDYQTRIVELRNGQIHWNERLQFPARPMVGTIGVAPEIGAPHSVDNGRHGGNMDVQETEPGNTLVLISAVEGGLLYLGDAQIHQGDGELACTSIEARARVHLSIERRSAPKSMSWPRLEGSDFLMTIVPAHPLEEAFKLAFQELVLWVEEEYGADRTEAYMLLGQTVEARATQICNPKPTYVCKLKKQFLKAFGNRTA